MFPERVLWARHCSKHSTALAHFILTILFGGPYEQVPFTEEQIEAQGGEATCLRKYTTTRRDYSSNAGLLTPKPAGAAPGP